jgi:hypothetical protein
MRWPAEHRRFAGMIDINSSLLGGAISTIAGGWAVGLSLFELGRAADSTDWPTVTGEIEETGVLSSPDEDGIMYSPTVRYHYKVGDEQYLSDRIGFGGAWSINIRWLADAMLDKYRNRKQVTVSVSPEDPRLCCLEPGLHWTTPFMLLIGALFLGLGISSLLKFFGWEGAWSPFS